MAHTVFISHSHDDKGLAEAVAEVIRTVASGTLEPKYSSADLPAAGIRSGGNWFRTLVEWVRDARFTVVLLTPGSIQKPWPMWESGAASGVTYAADAERPVIPIRYGGEDVRIPGPLQHLQAIDGTSRASVRKMLEEHVLRPLIDLSAEDASLRSKVGEGYNRLDKALDTYIARARDLLLDLPMPLTEAAVTEWCARLDGLRQANRLGEVAHVHRWIRIAFGRTEESEALDLRIHRRLGDMYLGVKEYEKAVEQFGLARRLAPRDIYVLRALGEALVKKGDIDAAEEILRRIEALDEKAFVWNAECAGLKGSWYRKRGQFRDARDMYQQALERSPSSYYMADNVGQLSLKIGDLEKAREAYRRVVTTIVATGEDSTWSNASMATALLVLDDEPRALDHLRKIAGQGKATPGERASIESGLLAVGESLGRSREHIEVWRAALQGASETRDTEAGS